MIHSNDAVIRTLPNLNGYDAPRRGIFYFLGFAEEVAWFATADDRVIGVVIRDQVDDNEDGIPPGVYFRWELLTRKPVWEVVDQDTDDPFTMAAASLPAGVYRVEECSEGQYEHGTVEEATAELHAAMLLAHERTLSCAINRARFERFGNGSGEPSYVVEHFGPCYEYLTVMSATEAAEFGIADAERGNYYRFDALDAADAPRVPARDATWFRMATANDVAEFWNPPR